MTLHILPSGRQDKSSVDSIKCAIPAAKKALDNIFSEHQKSRKISECRKTLRRSVPESVLSGVAPSLTMVCYLFPYQQI